MGPNPHIDPNLAERPLSEEDLLLRKAFVKEFMKTRNAYTACISLGFMAAYAADWGKAFMEEGVVRRLISEADRQDEGKEAALERQRKYRAWLEAEATYHGAGASHGSRVAAIVNLIKMEGIDQPRQEEEASGPKGGVMMVPVLTDVDNWGALAAKSQQKLKETVKD